MALQVAVHIEESKAILTLQGWFDFSAQRIFHGAWEKVSARPGLSEIEVDFGNVTFLDSTALGMLLVAKEQAEKAERALALANCSRAVRSVLARAKFDKLLTIRRSVRQLAVMVGHLYGHDGCTDPDPQLEGAARGGNRRAAVGRGPD